MRGLCPNAGQLSGLLLRGALQSATAMRFRANRRLPRQHPPHLHENNLPDHAPRLMDTKSRWDSSHHAVAHGSCTACQMRVLTAKRPQPRCNPRFRYPWRICKNTNCFGWLGIRRCVDGIWINDQNFARHRKSYRYRLKLVTNFNELS